MAAKKKAAKAGAGACAAGKAARDNVYVQRLVEDEELRDNLRTAYQSTCKAYARMSGRKGPVRSVTEDKKTQKELREAAKALRDAADSLRGAKRRRQRRSGRLLVIAVVGVGLALVLNEGLRKKLLDALFGAEEQFDPGSNSTPAASVQPSQPVGAT